ncbi:response regulator [Candidatus Odyssella thessalonicensis]|uniref:response regulator n=1 Tax=Candidatus Odyssella thessalonicensis TaxID=84647 RepID=UPI000225B1A8|nr:response regulator [Candidatus Odyssella thessalonicensis]
MNHLPFYKFPSTIVLIDDIETTVEEVAKLFEDEPLRTKVFTDQHEALAFINRTAGSPGPTERFQEALANYDNLFLCHEQIYVKERFNQISCVVVDYDMPGMNGLELCEKITDKRIKKILLTGVADEQVVINAFNRGLIDYFIRKHDQNSPQLVIDFVQDAINRFFYDLTWSFVDTAINQSSWVYSPLKDPKYHTFFSQFIRDQKIVEYYLLDISGAFLLVDTENNIKIMQTFTPDLLDQHVAELTETYQWSTLEDDCKQAILKHEQVLCTSPLMGKEDPEYVKVPLQLVCDDLKLFVAIFDSVNLEISKINFFSQS